MIFKSDIVKAQWDTWCYYHYGTYYLYYLISENSVGEGFGVATSGDGVHWEDQGWAISQSSQNAFYLGTGAVWRDPEFDKTGKFLCNYSEHRKDNDKITQNILFAWSDDLIHWHKFGDEYMFRVDEKFYDKYGRWDCIFPMPRDEGGYWGTWTATAHPDSSAKGIVGIGYSEDGVKWTALNPPLVEPGVDESGAFCKFGGKIYAMFGAGGSMWCYSADDVTGPYRRVEKNKLLLSSGHTYFSRFFPMPDCMLVNHHSMSGTSYGNRPITYMAPLKLAVLDNEGVFRLKYWQGNEKLKGDPVASKSETSSTLSFMTDALDFVKGIIAEGELLLPDDDKLAGIYLDVDDKGFAVCVRRDGTVEMGLMSPSGDVWEVKQKADREWNFGKRVSFRLLVRRGMLEFYMDDHFMECYTLEGCGNAGTVKLGLVGNNFSNLKAWQMNLQ